MSNILAGAVAGLRMMVDGTIRVSLDFEPKDRAAVMALLGVPGAMVGCARLQDGTGSAGRAPKEETRGPLCMEAIGLCNNADFLRYVRGCDGGKWRENSDAAKGYILGFCGVDSRKELDLTPGAANRFRVLQEQFRRWMVESA
jgi:hypothetical protein